MADSNTFLSSMTGFGRSARSQNGYLWNWEIKTVNNRGLDIKLRLPSVLDEWDARIRGAIAAQVQRGSVQAQLALTMPPRQPVVTINEAVLQQLLQALKNAMPDLAADRIDPSALLQVRGVVEVTDESSDPSTVEVLGADILSDLDLALAGVVAMRRQEGAQLRAVLAERVDTMQRLVERAENAPGRKAPAIEARLAAQIAMIMETGASLDPIRLHQEAVLLAAKADIREELDRLKAHIPAARQLIAQGGVIGRRLDFLAQELGRETNTLCAKSNDSELTTIGLELKTVVEQFREQVQNIE